MSGWRTLSTTFPRWQVNIGLLKVYQLSTLVNTFTALWITKITKIPRIIANTSRDREVAFQQRITLQRGTQAFMNTLYTEVGDYNYFHDCTSVIQKLRKPYYH